MMSDLHPDRFGYQIGTDGSAFGRNNNDGTYSEIDYIRCKKCGHIFNSKRFPKGRGEGNSQHSTQLNGAVSAGATSITVDSTTGFDSSGTIYIYDTGVAYSTDRPMDKVTYTGVSATSFTGCTGITTAHVDNAYVKDERVASAGCPFCGTWNYD